jgi:2-phosphosulfolactate phosphatase
VADDDLRSVFEQGGYRIRAEWGEAGVDALASGCAVLIIVDVLSFTTSVDIAVERGARILPLRRDDEVAAAAAALTAGAALATSRAEWRPSALLEVRPGTLLAVSSPNGATLCSRAATSGTLVLAGCLRNATAVAALAASLADGRPIGVVPGGERWGIHDGPLRPSVEDYLGAGAIVAALLDLGLGPASPEAELAATAYRATRDVPAALAGCASGRELIARGDLDDVELAAQVGASSVAPRLVGGVLTGD